MLTQYFSTHNPDFFFLELWGKKLQFLWEVAMRDFLPPVNDKHLTSSSLLSLSFSLLLSSNRSSSGTSLERLLLSSGGRSTWGMSSCWERTDWSTGWSIWSNTPICWNDNCAPLGFVPKPLLGSMIIWLTYRQSCILLKRFALDSTLARWRWHHGLIQSGSAALHRRSLQHTGLLHNGLICRAKVGDFHMTVTQEC